MERTTLTNAEVSQFIQDQHALMRKVIRAEKQLGMVYERYSDLSLYGDKIIQEQMEFKNLISSQIGKPYLYNKVRHIPEIQRYALFRSVVEQPTGNDLKFMYSLKHLHDEIILDWQRILYNLKQYRDYLFQVTKDLKTTNFDWKAQKNIFQAKFQLS